MKYIHLISGPRNISTALMYSFGNRLDCNVIDEPFYAYYLSKYGVDHPGRNEVIASQSTHASQVVDSIFNREKERSVLFIKNMAHHLNGFDYSFIDRCTNLFLIRDPRFLINSFAKVITHPTADDLGLRREYEIYKELDRQGLENRVVIDSGELLKDPPKYISLLCDRLDIPMDNDMLSWVAGPRKEDGVWAKHWYGKVHTSTGFVTQSSSSPQLDSALTDVYNEVKEYYDFLYDKALKV